VSQAPVLIIGGYGGIGSALARDLTAKGRPVHLAGRDEAKLAALAAELHASHSICDALDDASLEAAVGAASVSGELAGLVYAVGSIILKPLRRAGARDFLEAYALNVVGAAQAVRHGQRALARGNGAALFFSTVAVSQGFPNHAVISAAKGGIEGLTRALAAELAPKVRVNCLAPSLTRTPLAAALTEKPAMADAIAAAHPLGRLGEPSDLAALGTLLLSPEASWITGQVIGVDGGRSRLRIKD
jgi:NAD(P)-dependent dehydrogenase (short-subunit alcohol dehydrogenase family)